VFNRHGTFNHIVNKSLEDPSYVILHCNLLDNATLTTIVSKMKSPRMELHDHFLPKKHVCEGRKFWCRIKILKGFEKNDVPIIITIESMTIMFSIPPFEPKLVLMLFHINFIKEFRTLVQT
jgi:hypothetical protein